MYFTEEELNKCTQECPSVCWHLFALFSDVDKDVLLGSFGSRCLSCRCRGWHFGSPCIIPAEWEGEGWGHTRGLVSWVVHLISTLKSISSVFRSSLWKLFKLQARPSLWMGNGHRVFYSLSSHFGGPWDILVPQLVVRFDSGVYSRRNWPQLVQLCWFALVFHAEQFSLVHMHWVPPGNR